MRGKQCESPPHLLTRIYRADFWLLATTARHSWPQKSRLPSSGHRLSFIFSYSLLQTDFEPPAFSHRSPGAPAEFLQLSPEEIPSWPQKKPAVLHIQLPRFRKADRERLAFFHRCPVATGRLLELSPAESHLLTIKKRLLFRLDLFNKLNMVFKH